MGLLISVILSLWKNTTGIYIIDVVKLVKPFVLREKKREKRQKKNIDLHKVKER